MPWTGPEFAARHNRGLGKAAARKAAGIANAMLSRGAPEGEAIATANKQVKRQARSPGFRGRKHISYRGA